MQIKITANAVYIYITRYYILKQKKNKETKDFKEMR